MTLESLNNIPSSIIGDCLDRLNGITGLQRYDAGASMVGRALTVKTRPGDNRAIYQALVEAKPGDVLMVDGGAEVSNALVGGLAKAYAQERGIVGFVIDGAIRDVDDFEGCDSFGCFARAVSLRGPYKDGPGKTQVPVSVGGQVVCPGDIVVGDNDGLVVFSPDLLGSILKEAGTRVEMEAKVLKEIQTGSVQQSWLEAVLAGQTNVSKGQ